jgi:cysteine desulfurase
MKAETMQIAFDLAGVALSAGSACSSGKVGPSHVLRRWGLARFLPGALRVSIGRDTGEAEFAAFEAALKAIAGAEARAGGLTQGRKIAHRGCQFRQQKTR